MKQFLVWIMSTIIGTLFWQPIVSIVLMICFAIVPVNLNFLQVQMISLPISFIIFLETFVKLSNFRIIDNINPQDSANSTFLERELSDPDTLALEELGFERIIEYSLFSDRVICRILSHRDHYCFARVFQMNNTSLGVLLSSYLEQDWLLTIATNKPNSSSYVLYRQPKNLVKFMSNSEGISPSFLLSYLLQWRQEVMSTLKLDVVRDMTAESYWEWHYRWQKQQKRKLSKKSMTIALVEMLIFSLNPKTEWLEGYEKIRKESYNLQ